MIYLQNTYKIVPRDKLGDALAYHADLVYPIDSERMAEGGARFVGIWYSDIGESSDIMVLSEWPDLDARVKVDEKFVSNIEIREKQAPWAEITPSVCRRLWLPACHSPLKPANR